MLDILGKGAKNSNFSAWSLGVHFLMEQLFNNVGYMVGFLLSFGSFQITIFLPGYDGSFIHGSLNAPANLSTESFII